MAVWRHTQYARSKFYIEPIDEAISAAGRNLNTLAPPAGFVEPPGQDAGYILGFITDFMANHQGLDVLIIKKPSSAGQVINFP